MFGGHDKGPGFTGVYHVSKIQEAIAAIQTKQHVVVQVEDKAFGHI
jgi:hypothetical protein